MGLEPKISLQNGCCNYYFFKKGIKYLIKNKMLTTTAYRVVCGVLLTYTNKDWPGKYHPLKIQWSNNILSGCGWEKGLGWKTMSFFVYL